MPESSTKAKSKAPRSLSTKAERALKDAVKITAKAPDAPPEQKSLMQVEQAKVLALLELAASIRAAKGQ